MSRKRNMKPGVFAGLTGLDIVYYQNSIPSENKKSKTNNYNIFAGGPAANAAITYAMLGGNALLFTCIGNSEIGKIIKKELTEDYGVDIIDCACGSDMLPSISSIAVNLTNASRTILSGQQLFESKFEVNLKEVLKEAAFCFSDCNLADVSMKVLHEAKKESKSIILDAGSWKDKFELFLSLADDVIASADCKPPSHSDDFITVAGKYGVKNIAVTSGADSIQWKSERDNGIIRPPQVEAKDTLGAGDVFHGSYCYFKFERGLSFQDSLNKAAEVASSSVKYFGPREGVKEYIKSSM